MPPVGGQITPLAVVKSLFAASLVNMLLPLLIVGLQFEDRTFARPAAACRLALDANRVALEAVAKVLFERGRIDGAEVANLFKLHGGGDPNRGTATP